MRFDWYIYALCDLDGQVRYIGKAVDPGKRFQDHWDGRFVEKSHKAYWLRKLEDPPLMRILDYGSGPWDEAERFYIRFFREEVESRLTNVSPGGDGTPRGHLARQTHRLMTEEQKLARNAKISAAKIGKPQPWCREVALRMKGKKRSDEFKQKVSTGMKLMCAGLPVGEMSRRGSIRHKRSIT